MTDTEELRQAMIASGQSLDKFEEVARAMRRDLDNALSMYRSGIYRPSDYRNRCRTICAKYSIETEKPPFPWGRLIATAAVGAIAIPVVLVGAYTLITSPFLGFAFLVWGMVNRK